MYQKESTDLKIYDLYSQFSPPRINEEIRLKTKVWIKTKKAFETLENIENFTIQFFWILFL